MIVVVWIRTAAMAAEKTHVIHKRVGSSFPKQPYRAWIHAAGKNAEPTHDVVSGRRRNENGFGRPNALVAGRAVEQIELCLRRMQSQENGVRLHLNRVAHDIMSAGEIQHAMRCDRLLKGGGVVADAVALHAEFTDIGPFLRGRQHRNCAWEGRGQNGQSLRIVDHADMAHDSLPRHDESIRELTHTIERAFSRNPFARFAQQGEDWHLGENSVLESNLRERALLVADNNSGAGKIFEAAVFDP